MGAVEESGKQVGGSRVARVGEEEAEGWLLRGFLK